jgi:hypothetical protein
MYGIPRRGIEYSCERLVSKIAIHNSGTAPLGNVAVKMHHPWDISRSVSNPCAALECSSDSRGSGSNQLLVHAIE